MVNPYEKMNVVLGMHPEISELQSTQNKAGQSTFRVQVNNHISKKEFMKRKLHRNLFIQHIAQDFC
jgi:hypothetical protein